MQKIPFTRLNNFWQSQKLKFKEFYLMGQAPIAQKLSIFGAVYLGYIIVGALFLYSYYQGEIFLFFYSMLSGVFGRFILHPLIHIFYKRQRPIKVENIKPLIETPITYAFPSGHTSFLLGVGFFFLPYNIVLSGFLIILALVIGISRIFCRVHWWQDIIGSIPVALLSSLIVYYLLILF